MLTLKSYLREEVEGSLNVGFTKRDCYNIVNKQKIEIISIGDSQKPFELL
jgi:hypothetical protein